MTVNKCSKQYQKFAIKFPVLQLFPSLSWSSIVKFSLPDFFASSSLNCFDSFSLHLASTSITSLRLPQKQFRAKRTSKLFFLDAGKAVLVAYKKRILHFIASSSFHPVLLNIQATANDAAKKQHRDVLSAKNQKSSRNFHLWSEQRVFKEACRCLRLLFFQTTHKNTSRECKRRQKL